MTLLLLAAVCAIRRCRSSQSVYSFLDDGSESVGWPGRIAQKWEKRKDIAEKSRGREGGGGLAGSPSCLGWSRYAIKGLNA